MRSSPGTHALAAPLALMLAALPARAYQQERSDDGARVHLLEMPVRVRLGAPLPDLPDGGASAIRHAMSSWESPGCTSLRFTEVREPTDPGGDGAATFAIRYIAAGWPHGRTLAAHTTVTSDPRTGAILEAVIELNGAYRFTTEEPVPEGALDLESVVLHELGHFIGLAHSPHRYAVMRAGVKPGAPPRRALQEDDIAGVCAVYPVGRAAPAGRADLRGRADSSLTDLGTAALTFGAPLAPAAAGLWGAFLWSRRRRARSAG